MSNKSINNLPVVLQTTAIKNFFESTVDQLYSKANTEIIKGYIGKKQGTDSELSGAFINHDDADRFHYALSPAVNNINPVTGDSENAVFFDEFVDILESYGVNTRNQNLLFSSQFRTFMPPIAVDKFLNFAEYFWYPQGPSVVTISATSSSPINLEKDVLGKTEFTFTDNTVTSPDVEGKSMRNGMIVTFTGDYVTPGPEADAPVKADVEYIVQGVGEGIYLIPKTTNDNTIYNGNHAEELDYIVIERGAVVATAWSRINHWFHVSNFTDVGDTLPEKEFRAKRPIIELDRRLELYNHGERYAGTVTLLATEARISEVVGQTAFNIDGIDLSDGDTVLFINEVESKKNIIYTVAGEGAGITLTELKSLQNEDTIDIRSGLTFGGYDYIYRDGLLVEAQQKEAKNTAPEFQLYDDNRVSLTDPGLYPNSTFTGNNIFGYKQGTGTNDPILGFPLSYTQFKNASEISFENFIETTVYHYSPFGSTEQYPVKGTYYYKLAGDTPEFFSYWRDTGKLSEQKILTTYQINASTVSDQTIVYDIGAVPRSNPRRESGYDIVAKLNGTVITEYVYENESVKFNNFLFKTGDVLEFEVLSDIGITKINNSRYDIPLSWKSNPENNEIEIVAEPEYLPHFKRYIETQDGFSGDALSVNNFNSIGNDISKAQDIVQTNDDLILSAFLLDDQPHNLIDALRFNAKEYEKYKNRLVKEINNYNNLFDVNDFNNEYILEKVLRNLISFSVGKNVFSTTYILPFGDNYTQEEFDVTDVTEFKYTLSTYEDITKLENTVLVYFTPVGTSENRLLLLDDDYTISSSNPITVTLNSNKFSLSVGDVITTKLYDENRDSAECPPTPSALGLYPLHQPRIEKDYTFKEPIDVVVGHDGSRTPVTGDIQDRILLEFETRVYNSTQKKFRDANSQPLLNAYQVRAGAFRHTLAHNEYSDLLRNSFINWNNVNSTDYLVNQFYDEDDKWSWNYRGNLNIPGHWKGWYEYYYDTVRPNTHPWEMLGFFEKPTWWDSQYGTEYSSQNIALWSDLEQGIIRQGTRENVSFDKYKSQNNVFARPGLSALIPVNENGELLSPADITDTGTTTTEISWFNKRHAPLDVTDQIYDINGVNYLPNGINVTHGTGESIRIAWDQEQWDLYNRGFDSFLISNIYIQNTNINKSYQLYNYNFSQLGNSTIIVDKEVTTGSADMLGDTAVGITVTGVPIINPKSTVSWNNEGEWTEDAVVNNIEPEYGTYIIEPKHAGLAEWDEDNHSPVVGWSFDGLPIYGPYGYAAYDGNGFATDNKIVRVKSAFTLKAGTRPTGPGGAYTGEYVQDFEYTTVHGYTRPNQYNLRYGVTPDSPTTPIYFYVATVSELGKPMFPYVFGGTKSNADVTYEGKYYSYVIEPEKNNSGTITEVGELTTISSRKIVNTPVAESASRTWRFGDGAPVENAWKYSSAYPFAVVESLALAKPGRFVSVFADPTTATVPAADDTKLINIDDRTIWKFAKPEHFRVHGDIDSSGNTIVNSGYTQFIYSWLTYQGLVVKTDFVDKLRTVNTKLAHRLEGFTDKDTMKLRSDQFSSTGSTNSLLIPEENFDITIHSSPYKNRNFYSGVIIQKVSEGYKVRGYDKNLGYFNILKPNKFGRTSEIEVGGEPATYVQWEPNVSYPKDSIVSYNNRYWQAPNLVTSSQSFISSLWKPIANLPQRGAVKGVVYQDSIQEVIRIDYETVYATHQELFEFLIALGNYNESIGFSFGEFDTSINDTRNWVYAAKQFLFWVAGGWENNNTLELSPLAKKVRFESSTGAVAKINRIERNQFSLLDENGQAIQPSECEIIRLGTDIEIIPPAGKQIYACLLYTKQIEHAIIVDNVTDFNDTIYNPVFSQKQDRLRVKGKKTANWDGRFSSEGFIISGDELKPNLENLTQSLGRYHELGFIPVEKQLYDSARSLFGYQEREYLTTLEIDDDTQFEFYSGMIHEKGTTPALSKIAKSNNIIQGEMTVFDEWAFKVGTFGDLENDQRVELLLDRADFVQDPQLVTLAFPEDTTGVISEIRVIDAQHKHHVVPTIEIAAPTNDPMVTATAQAVLNSKGQLERIDVTNKGSGYPESVKLTVIASDVIASDIQHRFRKPVAQSELLFPADLNGMTLTAIELTDYTTDNANIIIDISSATTADDIQQAFDTARDVYGIDVTCAVSVFNMTDNNVEVTNAILRIAGDDFELNASSTLTALGLSAGRYQPKQRFNVTSFDATTDSKGNLKGTATTTDNVTVFVDSVNLPASENGTDNWAYDHGSKTAIRYAIVGIPDQQRLNPNSSSGIPSETTVFTGPVTMQSPFNGSTFAVSSTNLVSENNVYPHVDLYIDGELVTNTPEQKIYEFVDASTLRIVNVATLPQRKLDAGSNVYILEHSTVTLDPSYEGDTSNSQIRIKVTAEDSITAITRSERLYDITPDLKNDEVILIDIDDKERFLKKPIGVKDNGLWPTMSNISFEGVNDNRYYKIPNAGYINKANVDFRAFRVQDIPLLFSDGNLFHPEEGNTIHIASSENKDWNVYKIKGIDDSLVSYVEMEEGDLTSYLYSDIDLFQYTDNNQILDDDTGRFLDYHLVIKNTAQNEKFVVWTNQEVVNAKQVRIENLKTVDMIEANVVSIAPTVGSTYPIVDMQPAVGRITSAAIKPVDVNTIALVTNTSTLRDGDMVMLATSLTDFIPSLHALEVIATNVVPGSFRAVIPTQAYDELLRANVGLGEGIIDSANITISHYNKTSIAISPETQLVVANSAISNSLANGEVVTQEVTGATGTVVNISDNVFALEKVTGRFEIGNSSLSMIASVTGDLNVYIDDVIATHPFSAGQQIRVEAGAYTGVYQIESASDYELRINAPYLPNGPQAGTVLTKNITITTDVDHGLDGYIGKIGVHNHHVKQYNKTFDVKYASGKQIQVTSIFPVASQTAYSKFNYTANANVNVSVGELVTQSNTNAQGTVIAVDGATLVMDRVSGGFDINQGYTISGNVSGELGVQLTSAAGALLSTLDHDMIYPNGRKIKLDNIQSADGMVESFNRRQALMRAWLTYQGSFGMSIPMLKLPTKDSILNTAGSTPYVTNLNSISTVGVSQVGAIKIPDSVAKKLGFNKDTGTTVSNKISASTGGVLPISRTKIQPRPINPRVSGKPANNPSNPAVRPAGITTTGTSFNNNTFASVIGTGNKLSVNTRNITTPFGSFAIPDLSVLSNVSIPSGIAKADPIVPDTGGKPANPGGRTGQVLDLLTDTRDKVVNIPLISTQKVEDKCWKWAGVAPPPGYSYEACKDGDDDTGTSSNQNTNEPGFDNSGPPGGSNDGNTGPAPTGTGNGTGSTNGAPVINPGILGALKSICNTVPTPPPTNGPNDDDDDNTGGGGEPPPPPPSTGYDITLNKSSVDEGGTVLAYITTSNVPVFTEISVQFHDYKGSFPTPDADDFVEIIDESIGAIRQTGNNGRVDKVAFINNGGWINFKVNNEGKAGPIRFRIKEDRLTEEYGIQLERFRLNLYTGFNGTGNRKDMSNFCKINDTSKTPVQPPPNYAPDAIDDNFSTSYNVAVTGNILVNDSDPEDDAITIVSHTNPVNGTLTLDKATGDFTYTPNTNFSGNDTFQYTIRDTENQQDTATVTISVAGPINQPPVAVADNYTTEYQKAVSGAVLPNDSDPDGDTITITSNTQPSNGALQFQANGQFTYTPKSGFSGTDSFRYTISDGNGGTDTATVTITVEDEPVVVNPPPPPSDPLWWRYFQSQSTTSGNQGHVSNVDYYYYDLKADGIVTLVFHNYSEADKIEIHQVTSKVKTGGIPVTSTLKPKTATIQEKANLLSGGGIAGAGRGPGSIQTLPNYSTTNQAGFLKNCGKIVTASLSKSNGGVIRVKVTKPSNVYAYYIDVPDPNGKTLAEWNASSGAGIPVDDTNRQAAGTAGSTSTSTFQPAGTYTGKPSVTGYYGSTVKNYGAGGAGSTGVLMQQNFAGWSAHPMAGFRHLPSVFRRNDVRLTNTQNYGKYSPVTGSRYVSTTHQRISGGEVVPLAAPLPRPIRIFANPIRSTTLDGSFLSSITSTLANGKDLLFSVPRPLTIGIPNSEVVKGVFENSDTITLGQDIVFQVPAIEPGNEYPGVTIDDPNAPANVSVDYVTQPVITIQPKRRDGNISIPVGKPAFATMYKPTPSARIKAEDTTGVQPGDQIVINGTPITIASEGYTGVLNSLKCADIPGITVRPVGSGRGFGGAIKISSCSAAPIKFANGCSGAGQYKEILDFHVVKSFTDSLTDSLPGTGSTTESYTYPSTTPGQLVTGVYPVQQTAYNFALSSGNANVVANVDVSLDTDEGGNISGANVSSSNAAVTNGIATGSAAASTIIEANTSQLIPESTSTTVIPQVTTTSVSKTRTVHTGGEGYSVGDRLRLVGGTPIADPYGSITKICIENTGANYTDAANIRINIGDGSTPGEGAEIDEITLDPDTNGIIGVTLKKGGVGYDVSRPPVVTVQDFGASSANIVATPAQLSAKVETTPFKVPRVAKFLVTAIDTNGGILGLQIIDRGVYKQLPPDLDRGLPLEYDYILEGDVDDGESVTGVDFNNDGKISTKPTGTGLGQWDPLNNYAFLGSPVARLRGFDDGTGVTSFDPYERVRELYAYAQTFSSTDPEVYYNPKMTTCYSMLLSLFGETVLDRDDLENPAGSTDPNTGFHVDHPDWDPTGYGIWRVPNKVVSFPMIIPPGAAGLYEAPRFTLNWPDKWGDDDAPQFYYGPNAYHYISWYSRTPGGPAIENTDYYGNTDGSKSVGYGTVSQVFPGNIFQGDYSLLHPGGNTNDDWKERFTTRVSTEGELIFANYAWSLNGSDTGPFWQGFNCRLGHALGGKYVPLVGGQVGITPDYTSAFNPGDTSNNISPNTENVGLFDNNGDPGMINAYSEINKLLRFTDVNNTLITFRMDLIPNITAITQFRLNGGKGRALRMWFSDTPAGPPVQGTEEAYTPDGGSKHAKYELNLSMQQVPVSVDGDRYARKLSSDGGTYYINIELVNPSQAPYRFEFLGDPRRLPVLSQQTTSSAVATSDWDGTVPDYVEVVQTMQKYQDYDDNSQSPHYRTDPIGNNAHTTSINNEEMMLVLRGESTISTFILDCNYRFDTVSTFTFKTQTTPDYALPGTISEIAWVSTTPGGNPIDGRWFTGSPTDIRLTHNPDDTVTPEVVDTESGDIVTLEAADLVMPFTQKTYFVNYAVVWTSEYNSIISGTAAPTEQQLYSNDYDYPQSGRKFIVEYVSGTGNDVEEPQTLIPEVPTIIKGKDGFDPNYNAFWGGRGARLYFTSREIPDCSQKGSAREALGLPEIVEEPDYPREIADMFNDALVDAGFNPEDIVFDARPINTDISVLVIDGPGYDGVELGELTPGFLDKIGLPIGDYDHALACMVMTNETQSPDYNPQPADLRDISDENGFTIPNELETEVLSITCVDRLDQPPGTILGEANVSFITDLYQYELRTIYGEAVTTPYISQGAVVHYLESQRYRTEDDIVRANVLFPEAHIPLTANQFDKVWIDEFSLSSNTISSDDRARMRSAGAKDTGWAHLENGVPKRWQTDLVDPKFMNDIILYDRTTGEKDYNLDLWDPFKGVLPAFVEAEIHFISEQDPVVYNSKRARFTRENVGQVWWDTSTIKYEWYEQGPNRERWLNWGTAFPGSSIALYEWVESDKTPLQYAGTGLPKNGSEFIAERRIDRATGEYKTYYYYWVQNKTELSSTAKDQYKRKFSTYDLAKYLSDPIRQGINTISFISSGDQESKNQASFFVSNLSQILREDEQILQINLSRTLNPLGLKHTSWKLLRENDVDSIVPEDLSAKLIDSLCEQDATGKVVPAENLSEVERYGVEFRPRQTMFKEPAEARRVMHYVLNDILADLKLESLHPVWEEQGYIGNYITVANWYAVKYVDSLNNKVRYDSSYKPVYTVQSVRALDTLKQSALVDGTVVMVRAKKTERYQLWEWSTKSGEFKLIAIQNETAALSDRVYTDSVNSTMQDELRSFLYECKEHLFDGTELWNKFFFEMVKYAYGEQLQLPWAFKTSYIYVDKEESDLTQRQGYRPDNFESVVEYMNEVKPYTAKIREYKDGKRTPVDYISDQMVSDFDKPPYADPVAGAVRILDGENKTDANILATHPDYVKWSSVGDIASAIDPDRQNLARWDALGWQAGRWDSSLSEIDSPVRTISTKLVFDRVDWRLLDSQFDASNTSYAQSTAAMISYLNSDSNSNVSSNTSVTMSGRIFKFDDEVRNMFAEEIDAAYGEGASSDTTIITDAALLESAFLSGSLTGTLALVKEKVGGGFRGEELDANVFTKVISGEDPLTLQSAFGFDTNGWDSNDGTHLSGWDTSIEVQNIEGVFEGNTTLRRSGITYEGFDSVTFQKVLYGEERPEEMALFSPLENLIMNVKTTTLAYGNGPTQPATAAIALGPYPVETSNADSNNIVNVTTEYQGQLLSNSDVLTFADGLTGDYAISNVTQNGTSTSFTIEVPGYTTAGNVTYQTGPESVDVEYIVHYDMFGSEEYLRIKGDNSTKTTLSRSFEMWDDKLFVTAPELLPEPKPGIPGVIWVSNTERIIYRTKNNVTGELSDITRGTRGTTIQKHIQGISVVSGYHTEVFNDARNEDYEFRNPDQSVWINSNMGSLTDVENRTVNDGIAAWLQGDSVAPIGFDARGWDINPWDTI